MIKKTTTLLVIFTFICTVQRLLTYDNHFHPEFDLSSQGLIPEANAYPPGVGILTKSKNCIACHVSNGPWSDESKTIIDILDATTKRSLKQPDGSFLLEAKRNEIKTVLTVIGRTKEDPAESPYRNAWTYIDPKTIEANTLNKFAPGWECNLQLSCRLVGDVLPEFDGARLTSLPMTVRPTDAARDGELQLQVMLTKGESVKGKAAEGIKGNYFEKKVFLKVME